MDKTNPIALFLDLDGTLLNDEKIVTDGNRRAIEEALAAGHRIIINTGRPLVSAITQAGRLNLLQDGCYLIAFNGGIIYDCGKKEILYREQLPLSVVAPIFAEANRRGIHIQTYDNDGVVVEPRNDTDNVVRYVTPNLMGYRVIPSIEELTDAPVKMLLIDFSGREKTDAFREWVIATYPNLDSFFSSAAYLEIVNRGLHKGNAMRRLCDLISIPMENTIAAGDEANDLPAIEAAAIGVCMANGIAVCKEAAQYVTKNDNNHDGIEEIIRTFML